MDKVWIISTGCIYEGGSVSSVHRTRESAQAAVDARLKREAEDLADMIAQSKADGEEYDYSGWDYRLRDDSDSYWCNQVDYISIREWEVEG